MKNKEIYLRDPFALPYNGKYYMYGTRSETAFSKEAFGFDVYVGTDLENWDEKIECFNRPSGFWATKNYWAPEVHVYRDSFYMFATFSDGRHQGTAILCSDSPTGPFIPWSDGTITPKEWSCLDGTFYVSKDGQPYMVFCHEWKDIHDGEILAVKLSDDLSKPISEPFTLFKASQGRPAIRPFLFRNFVTDGPFLLRTDDGKLHLLWSSFGKGGYVQAIAHSDSDEIDGVWTISQDLLFKKDGGHGMIFKTFDNKLFLTLHSPNRNNSEHPAFFPIEYKDGKLALK